MSSEHPKIGIVSVDFLPPFGGMGRHVRSLRDGLLQRGFAVSIFDGSKRPVLFRIARNLGFSFGIASALRRWTLAESIDVLHIHTGPGGVLLSKTLLIPTVVTVHHTYSQQSELTGQWYKAALTTWEHSTFRAASAIISVSEDTTKSLLSRYKIPADRITTIPPGFLLDPWIAADKPRADRDHMSIVFVGRRGMRKGFDLLLRAWQRIHVDFPSAKLSIVGSEGDSRDGVLYRGRISDEDLRVLVSSARFLVCPSRFEGFGLAAAEAIASGTPVLATNVPGLRSVAQDDVSGYFVPLEDSSSLEVGMRMLLTDDALWDRLHRGAQSVRHRFDVSPMIDAHISLYHRVYSEAS